MVAVKDLSGLVSSPCALASAAARAPTVSLERCIGRSRINSRINKVEADRAGFRSLGSDAMPGRLPGILRHQLLQLSLRPLMFLVGRPGLPVGCRERRPGVGGTHIDDPNRLQTGSG